MAGDGVASHFNGMSKHQLHEIMTQMKTLIEQNQQQARQILIDNPSLTKSLFQAQIMLGMVRPPQSMQTVKQELAPQPQQAVQPKQQPNAQPSKPLPTEMGPQAQANTFQPQPPARQLYRPPDSHPPLPFQAQPLPPNAIQQQESKLNLKGQIPSGSLPQSSQMPNMLPAPPLPSHPHPFLQSNMPVVSSQLPHPGHSTGVLHQPLQPPLPTQPRPPMQPYSNSLHSQFPQNPSFQPVNAPPQILSQPMFHSGTNLPNSFPQGPPPLPIQPPPQHLYNKGGIPFGSDFSNQSATPMQVDRGPWNPGPSDNVMSGMPLPGPPPPPANVLQGGQPSRPPQLTPEMEKALLQQVMSLTPEQINMLPPEQRQQVLQLQQMLR